MNNIQINIQPDSCYVLKDSTTNRYIKFDDGRIRLSTDKLSEAKLFNTYEQAKNETYSSDYKIRRVYIKIGGMNDTFENIIEEEKQDVD